PERRPVALDAVVRDVVEHMHVVAGERGLTIDPSGLGPCPVRGDEGLLRRLLFNLLDNAIKYTPAGGSVTVRGECSGGRVRVGAADTGVGTPAEHLPHVFERFYRADPARGRETEGTGLGLAICRAIVHSHGGDLRVESAPGRGTSVTLLLPADAPAPGAGDEGLHRGVTAGAARADRNGGSHDEPEGGRRAARSWPGGATDDPARVPAPGRPGSGRRPPGPGLGRDGLGRRPDRPDPPQPPQAQPGRLLVPRPPRRPG